MENLAPKVTVLCITYNHENFIKQTLDGFVMQKTNFDFEAIVSDDGSTDKTPEIITEYAKKYPKIIKPILRKKNIGAENNFFETYSLAKSPYVATCEGDDYWSNPLKLQKQADFLDTHPDFSICFHPVRIFYEDGSQPDSQYPEEEMLAGLTVFYIQHLLMINFIQTNSVMYRWRFNNKESLYYLFPKDIIPGDYFLHLLHAQRGKIGMINEVMADYRRHQGGLWWGSTAAGTAENDALHLKHGIRELKFYLELEKAFPEYRQFRGHSYTLNVARDIFNIYLRHKRFAEMKQIMELCPDLFGVKVP